MEEASCTGDLINSRHHRCLRRLIRGLDRLSTMLPSGGLTSWLPLVGDPTRVARVPGKGLGVVAERAVAPGEVILKEEPFISLPLTEEGDLQGKFDQKTGEFKSVVLDNELRKLSDKDLKKFYALSDAFRHKSSDLKTNFGIVKTNCFSVTSSMSQNTCCAPPPRTRLVLFPSIARINHSCLPNCHHYWSNRQGSFIVRAVQKIKKGEEICISYMSPLQRADFHTRESRRKILQDEFGFLCCCDICGEADPEKVAEDDEMRRRVLQIEEEWSELGSNPEAALSMGEEQLELCLKLRLQSGLLAYVALHCVEAAALVSSRRSAGGSAVEAERCRSRALAHAEAAGRHGRVAYGEGSEECRIFDLVADVCRESSNQDLLGNVQDAITALRDIDS